jgi:hypothetical protein
MRRTTASLRTPSSSLKSIVIVACVFVIAAGSGAVAAGLIHTSDIADRAVTGKKIAKDSITGAHIRERTLGAVENSRRVAGASLVRVRRRTMPQTGSPQSVVFKLGGLSVKSVCNFAQPDIASPTLTASTTIANANLQFSHVRGPEGSGQSFAGGDSDFDTGESLVLSSTHGTGVIAFTYSNGKGHVVAGNLSYSFSGPKCLVDGVVSGR